jgi:hypothetical protein
MTKTEAAERECGDILSFGLRHFFVIRHSDFGIVVSCRVNASTL